MDSNTEFDSFYLAAYGRTVSWRRASASWATASGRPPCRRRSQSSAGAGDGGEPGVRAPPWH